MKCKQCGWENPDNRERCEKCGNVLLRQRPFETPAVYDDQRAAGNPVSRDYGNVYGNVDPQYGPRPIDGGAPAAQPYGSQPYVGEHYGPQPNYGGAPAGQPYGPRPCAGQPYGWQPFDNDVRAQQPPSSPVYTQQGYDGQPRVQNAAGPLPEQQIKKEVSYCPECDAELPAGANACPVCHAVIRHESIEMVSVCRDCGTEVMPGQKFCHGCGARLNVPSVAQPAMSADGMQPDVADMPAAAADLAKTADSVREETAPQAAPAVGSDDDTVLAGPLAEEVPECTLQLVAAGVAGASGRIVECVGREVDLYRDNTDPANNTIARDLQARLTYDGGKWRIEDSSALRTTYIRPARKIELCDGDVIVMGNREFIFKSK